MSRRQFVIRPVAAAAPFAIGVKVRRPSLTPPPVERSAPEEPPPPGGCECLFHFLPAATTEKTVVSESSGLFNFGFAEDSCELAELALTTEWTPEIPGSPEPAYVDEGPIWSFVNPTSTGVLVITCTGTCGGEPFEQSITLTITF